MLKTSHLLSHKLRMTLVQFFNYIHDILFVSREIYQEEIIIRTLLQPKHISSGSMDVAPRKFADYFQPLNGGVSVDRYRYINENKVKKSAKLKFPNESAKYIGFAIFDISIFKESLKEYCSQNKDFKAHIVSSPLDLDNNVILSNPIFVFKKGNIAHADIIYSENEIEVPKTSIRKFSKILAEKSTILLDDDIQNSVWTKGKFSEKLK